MEANIEIGQGNTGLTVEVHCQTVSKQSKKLNKPSRLYKLNILSFGNGLQLLFQKLKVL